MAAGLIMPLSALFAKIATKVKRKLKRRSKKDNEPVQLPDPPTPQDQDIHVRVSEGARAKDLVVSDRVLTASSKVFQSALRNGWKEAVEGRVLLPEIDVSAFEGYLHWLRTGTVTPASSYERPDLTSRLVEQYLAGDFLDDDLFCNRVSDVIRARWGPPEEVIIFTRPVVRRLWEKALSSSPLRRMALDIMSNHSARSHGEFLVEIECHNGDPLPQGFYFEFLQHLFAHRTVANAIGGLVNPWLGTRCVYHEHGNGPGCEDGGGVEDADQDEDEDE